MNGRKYKYLLFCPANRGIDGTPGSKPEECHRATHTEHGSWLLGSTHGQRQSKKEGDKQPRRGNISTSGGEGKARDKAVAGGYVVEMLERYHEVDLFALDEEEREGINAAYQSHGPEPERLRYQDNGLAYLAGVVISIIRHGDWTDTGAGVGSEMDRLELEL